MEKIELLFPSGIEVAARDRKGSKLVGESLFPETDCLVNVGARD